MLLALEVRVWNDAEFVPDGEFARVILQGICMHFETTAHYEISFRYSNRLASDARLQLRSNGLRSDLFHDSRSCFGVSLAFIQ